MIKLLRTGEDSQFEKSWWVNIDTDTALRPLPVPTQVGRVTLSHLSQP